MSMKKTDYTGLTHLNAALSRDDITLVESDGQFHLVHAGKNTAAESPEEFITYREVTPSFQGIRFLNAWLATNELDCHEDSNA